MIQFIGLIIAGYCSVKMIEILSDSSKDNFLKVVSGINLVFTILFALLMLISGTNLPQ